MVIKAILFDLDDTLYNRDQAFERFVERFVADYSPMLVPGHPSALRDVSYQLDCHGYKPRREMFTEIIDRFSWRVLPGVEELIDYYCAEFPKYVEAGPELLPTLERCLANGIKMGVITNGLVGMQNVKIDQLGIRKYMSLVITSEGVGLKKPDPEMFFLALQEMNVENRFAMYVGDNPSVDVKGANNSGLVSVWLSNGRSWEIEEYKPVVTIERLEELTALLA